MTPRSSSRRSCRDSRVGESMPRSGSSSLRRMPAMLTLGFCRACNRALSTGAKKLIPCTVLPSTSRGLVRRPSTRTPAEKSSSAKQDLAQVDQAVDRFFHRCQLPGRGAGAVFHPSVVLEERHIVGGGLDTQHDAVLVIHLD